MRHATRGLFYGAAIALRLSLEVSDLRAAEDAVSLRAGDFKDEYKDPKTSALLMRYRMRTPTTLPEKKTLGLIVAFHGLKGNEDSLTGFAIESARRVEIADDYVIMGGKSKGEGWDAVDDKELLAWINWALETYPIDRRRVHLIGMSNGGWMVKRFGWAHQDLFASVSAYCGPTAVLSGAPGGKKAPPAQGPGSAADTRTEWYLVHGDADTVVGVDASRLAVKQLAQKGYRYVYREIDGADHVGILGFRDVADDNFRFIHALRHKDMPLSKEERGELAAIAAKLKTETAGPAGPLLETAMRLGGPAAAVAVKNALANPDVEVRKAAIAAAERVFFGREIAKELVKLTRDKAPEVKAAAFASLGTLAKWRYPEAQSHLVESARAKSLPIDDRVAAIRGLEKAVRLMLLGWYEDKDLLWSLVALLDDKEVAVREAAFAAMKEGVKDTFEYRPEQSAAERKASIAKWRSWCEAQAGPLKSSSAKS